LCSDLSTPASLFLVAEILQSSEACQQQNQKHGDQRVIHGTPTAWLEDPVAEALLQSLPESFQQRTPQTAEVQFAFLLRAAVSLDSK
jgi:hypothetical protein